MCRSPWGTMLRMVFGLEIGHVSEFGDEEPGRGKKFLVLPSAGSARFCARVVLRRAERASMVLCVALGLGWGGGDVFGKERVLVSNRVLR